ncbi:hypothetical protein F5Y15DRAFT_87907 [Xylariaceae sp. FL0016]|nr:hypothetical protein F5Y15DRAFT_87907 [Xylariaceae sp. FL0016]
MASSSNGEVRPRYKSLDHSRREIRLLELEPAQSPEDPVVCRLVNVRLAYNTEYIGLSTLYGDQKVIDTIHVDGLRIRLPANVVEALRNVRTVFLPKQQAQAAQAAPAAPVKQPPRWLRHLMKSVSSILPDQKKRKPHEIPLRVWLDLLCINSRDVGEEAQRRSHMVMAYESAKTVVGWLGPKDDTSDLAVEIIRAWDKCMPRNFGQENDRRLHPENYAPQMSWMAPVAHLSEVPPSIKDPADIPNYKAISTFLGRPYFQRTWILEEIAFARFPSFLVGDEIVSWMQVLRLNMANEEIKSHGAEMFPPELVYLLDYMPLGSVYTFLKEFEGRQRAAGLIPDTPTTTTTNSSAASVNSERSRP